MKTLIASAHNFGIEKITSGSDRIVISLFTTPQTGRCPQCGNLSTKVHSRYQRRVADLPWEGIAVQLKIRVRRFFCGSSDCDRRIFCELLPDVVAPYGRRTIRFSGLLQIIGFALGGRPAARAIREFGMQASARTLLRVVRSAKPAPAGTVRVLGVDDFALRRGQSYGTILINHEQRRIIDLLPDREAGTLERWLRQHPEIEIITRDRAPAYAEAAAKGAPQARQIADRFHLLKNLVDAVERVVSRHPQELRKAARETSEELSLQVAEPSSPEPSTHRLNGVREQRRQLRIARYEEIRKLCHSGMSQREVAKRLGISRQTVRKFAVSEQFPEIAGRRPRTVMLTPHLPYLQERWRDGCHNAAQLWREIQPRGYSGCAVSVRQALRQWRSTAPADETGQASLPGRTPSPRSATWYLLKEQGDSATAATVYAGKLLALSPEITACRELAREFHRIVRCRNAAAFDDWRSEVERMGPVELRRFANGLMTDEAAVRAALSEPWSNGRVEGNVNRLKTVKRSMYGRAGFDLLRQRLLASP